MTKSVRDALSFMLMAALIFIALNLFFLSYLSTGPHRFVTFGFIGWLRIHQNLSGTTVESISIAPLAFEVCLALTITTLLDLILRPLKRNKGRTAFGDGSN